jgi:hypothetical protein
MLVDKGELMRLNGPSPWCRVWRVELEDKLTWVEALDFMPEFSVRRLGGSEPCILVDDCACWRRGSTRRGREVFVQEVGVVAGEFGVVVEDVDEFAAGRQISVSSHNTAKLSTHLDVWAQMRSSTSRSLLSSSGSGSGSVAPGVTVPY